MNEETKLNDKEDILDKIVGIVAKCTSYKREGLPKITPEDLLGEKRDENISMARSILALQLRNEGYNVPTIAALLNRSEQATRKLIKQAYNNIASSRACRRAAAEVVLEIEKLYE